MTLQGLAVLAIGILAEKAGFTVSEDILISLIDEFIQAIGGVMVAIGRIRATHKLGDGPAQ